MWARGESTGNALGTPWGWLRPHHPQTSAFLVLPRMLKICLAPQGTMARPASSRKPVSGNTAAAKLLGGNQDTHRGSKALGASAGKPHAQDHRPGHGRRPSLGQNLQDGEGQMGSGCLQPSVPVPTSLQSPWRGRSGTLGEDRLRPAVSWPGSLPPAIRSSYISPPWEPPPSVKWQ